MHVDNYRNSTEDNPPRGALELRDRPMDYQHPVSPVPILFYTCVPGIAGSLSEEPRWRPVVFPTSHTTEQPDIDSIKIATWNVWFDKLEQHARFSGLLKELFPISGPSVDIIALQEVTPLFLAWLRSSPIIRSEWLMTDRWDLPHETCLPSNWYGNIFLVNQRWENHIRGWVQKFPTSKLGRHVELIELCHGKESKVLQCGDMNNSRFVLQMHILIQA